MPTFKLSDGCSLHYEDTGYSTSATTKTVVMCHGWSASSKSFDPVVSLIKERHQHIRVLRLDQRWHGRSSRTPGEHSVPLMARDLTEFIDGILMGEEGEKPVIVVGTSLGAAVIWAYIQAGKAGRLAGAAFVDQSPCQWRLSDWTEGCSKGCYDEDSLKKLKGALDKDMKEFAEGNESCCVTMKLDETLSTTLREETMLCKADDLASLMDDHARRDWRPVLKSIRNLKCVNYCGTESGVFPIAGTRAVTTLIGDDCKEVIFEGCNHWLYLEQTELFVASLAEEFFLTD